MIKIHTPLQDGLNTVRRIIQVLALLPFAAFPFSGLMFVDLETQSFTVFGNRIWPHELHLIALGILVFLMVLATFASVMGRVFCGWFCPQTLMCEITTSVQKAIGRSRQDGGPLQKYLLPLGALIVALSVAIFAGFFILGFFIPSSVLLGLFQGQVNTSVLKGIILIAFLLFVDVIFLRHAFCESMCIIGWWQRIFMSNRSLRVAFDTRRGKDCTRCEGCKNTCFMGIDPRKRSIPSTCLNCGRCVIACHKEQATSSKPTIIWYGFGGRPSTNAGTAKPAFSLSAAKTVGVPLVSVAIIAVFAWLIASRPMVQVKIVQAQAGPVAIVDGRAKGSFYVDVYNNSSVPVLLNLEESGLPSNSINISPNPISVESKQKARASFRFDADPSDLHPGRNVLSITAICSSNPSLTFSERIVFGLPYLPSKAAGLANMDVLQQ